MIDWLHWPDVAHPEARQRWERLRAGGRAAFVWRYGVFGWGAPCGIVSVCYHVLKERGFVWPIPSFTSLWVGIIGLLVASGATGYLLAAGLWDACEASYDRETRPDARPGP
ncbi:MAG TPA: hypothetical protein VNW46_02755 [Gemmatimonadaceae bacterium]|nr:hypothetical protein [Gemmatimonadaceae bacterium]